MSIPFKPEPPQEQLERLALLYYAGELTETEQSCKELLRRYPDTPAVINLLAAALRGLGRLKEAIQVFDQLIGINPDSAEVYNSRSGALTELGMIKEAISGYEQALELEPDYAHIHRNLAELKNYKTNDPQLALMEQCYADTGLDNSQHIHICFALAKAHDDLGNFDRSFTYLSEGNSLHKQRLDYDIRDDESMVKRIKHLFNSSASLPIVTDNRPISQRPVFIIGMPRSGTSLVEQILASHSRIHGAGELDCMMKIVQPILSYTDDELSMREIMAIRSAYLDALNALGVTKDVLTDKMPINFLLVGFILTALPEAKIIHVKRHPVATGWSLYRHYFPGRRHGYAYNLDDIACFYKLYTNLMEFWSERFPQAILELVYEELVNNQEVETGKLLSFCNLKWEAQCLEFYKTERPVQTASAAQIRKPIYKGSSEAWKNYRQYLEPLIAELI
jgi:tetratricopeptide (TPR) repeat protein